MGDSNPPDPRPRGPRLYHKKSRAGCLRCKQRRVKCDELHPSCSNCSRHLVECVYQTQPSAPVNAKTSTPGQSESKLPTPAVADVASVGGRFQGLRPEKGGARNPKLSPSPSLPQPNAHGGDAEAEAEADIDLPEGPWRRMWELRLLHNTKARMKQPFPEATSPLIVKLWAEDIPDMALAFAQKQGRCGLLYIEFAHSALHMWTTSTDKQERDELTKLQQTYQLMCSKEQRRDVNEIPHANPRLLDYICFTAIRIVVHSLALVQTLPLDPWEPPLQWLYMGHGAGTVFRKAWEAFKPEHRSIISTLANNPPLFRDVNTTILSDHSPLAWLLDHPSPTSIEAQADQELNDEGVLSVYHKALAYICSVMRAIDRKEGLMDIARRISAFPVLVPIEFSKFVEQRRPRALVVLAHFMATWIDYEHVWIIGRAGEWQIRCIYKNLPVEWSCKLDGLFAKFKQREIPS
ncbi:hypothetical protein F4861DRAFT_249484 [Xylaria intraflava]|nr:hypothetical protein F4861DRAFT_249484 [Xylaria intraflava]